MATHQVIKKDNVISLPEAVATPWHPPPLGHFQLNVDAVMGNGGVGTVDGLSVAIEAGLTLLKDYLILNVVVYAVQRYLTIVI